MTVPSLHGVRPGRRGKLKLIREAWKRLRQDTGEEGAPVQYRSQRDAPWWYPERTSEGLLSAAMWNIGGEAIEADGTDKNNKLRSTRHSRGT